MSTPLLVDDNPLVREYLDWLPPDERIGAERAFRDSPLLRVAVTRGLDLSAEEQKMLMAEFDVYAETGEIDPESVLGHIAAEAKELDAVESDKRARDAGRRSPLLRYAARAGYVPRMPGLEREFARVTPRDQAFLFFLIDLWAEVKLFEENGGEKAIARLRDDGGDVLRVK